MPKYEIHPDNKGQWLLYRVTGGPLEEVVAFFPDKADAEFALEAFEKRNAYMMLTDAQRVAVLETEVLRLRPDLKATYTQAAEPVGGDDGE